MKIALQKSLGPIIHIPHYLLCKANVVEKFDETESKVLSNIEIQLQLLERLECLNPSLKPFFRGKKAIILAGITAFMKLITHENSSDTVILAEEFDMLEQKGLSKHIFLV